MTILHARDKGLFALPEGLVLAVTGSAGSAATVRRVDPAVGGLNYLETWAVTDSAPVTIGAYAGPQQLLVSCTSGRLVVKTQDAVLTTTGGAIAAVITGSGLVDQPLTATLPAGVIGTLQFTKTLLATPFTKSNIAGAVANAVNSLQYTPSQADLPYRIGCDASNTVAPSAGVTLTAAPSNDVVPAVISAPIINGTPTAGAVVSSTAATFSGSPTPSVATTWRIDGVQVASGLPYSAPSDSATKSLVRRDTATNTAGSVYSDSAPVVIGAASVIVAEPQLFARPAAGLFYQGMIQSVKPGTSTPITAYDAEVAYRTTIGVDTVYVDVWNGVKINGDVPEQFLSMDTRWAITLNSTNAAGSTIAFPMVKNGTTDTTLTLAGGQFSYGTFMANTPGLGANKNLVLMIRIDSPDGVSNISVPLGNPADYGATVLGGSDGYGRGQEGSVYNSAASLTSKSPGGIEWAGRVPAHMVRPLAVYTKNAPKVRSCVVLSDSIGSPLDSYVARILNAANIANVNIGSGGESGNNYPQNTVGRSSVFPYARSAIVELGRNGFGMGLANVKAKHQAIWADLRAKGVLHVIQTEITPNTTAASTNPSPSTVEGQNPEAGGIRIQFNDWLATVVGTPGGPDEVWPVEGIVSTPDRLKFKAGMSGDYLHLLGAATTEILNVAVANNWTARIV